MLARWIQRQRDIQRAYLQWHVMVWLTVMRGLIEWCRDWWACISPTPRTPRPLTDDEIELYKIKAALVLYQNGVSVETAKAELDRLEAGLRKAGQ